MNDPIIAHHHQRREQLDCESSDKNSRKSHKAVRLDHLVQVDTEQLGDNAQMASEIEVLGNLDEVVLILWVPLDQILQDLDLDQSLVMETFLVADDFDGNALTGLVVSTLQDLSKRSFTQKAHDLIPVSEVISLNVDVVAPFIVIAVIIRRSLWCRLILFAILTRVPNRLVIQDFTSFIKRKRLEVSLDESMWSHLLRGLHRFGEVEHGFDFRAFNLTTRLLGLLPFEEGKHFFVSLDLILINDCLRRVGS